MIEVDMQKFPAAKGLTKSVVIDVGVITRAQKSTVKEGGRLLIADAVCKGLRLRVGRREAVWMLNYRPRGVNLEGRRYGQRSIRIGTVVDTNVAEARLKAGEIKREVASGRDPQAEKQRSERLEAQEKSRQQTLGGLASDYADTLPKTQHGRTEAAQVRLGLGEMLLTDAESVEFTTASVNMMLTKHAEKPATARLRFGALARFADWLDEDAGGIKGNPVRSVSRRKQPKPAKARRLVLNAEGVKAVWDAAPEMGEVKEAYLRTALLLPLRSNEIAELTPATIDVHGRAVVLGERETKNGEAFRLPVPDVAMGILVRRMEVVGGRGRLFQLNSAGGAMNAWSPFNRRIRKLSGIDDFRLHDVRKLFVTVLAEQGIGSADLADGLLNHRQAETRGGVKGVYQQSTQWPHKKALMREWGRLVAHAVEHGVWPHVSAEIIQFSGVRT